MLFFYFSVVICTIILLHTNLQSQNSHYHHFNHLQDVLFSLVKLQLVGWKYRISLSIFCNLIVLLLISEMPKKVFGSYKYLMFTFSTVGIMFSCSDLILKPSMHVTKTSFILFTLLEHSGFSKPVGLLFLSFSDAFYGMIITLLAIHFLYRYLSVVRPFNMTIFSIKYVPLWILVLVFNFSMWTFCFYYLNGPSEMKDEEVVPEFLEVYCLKPNEYTYTGPHYYYTDNSTGEWKFHIPSFIAEFYTGGNVAVTIISVAYFGHQTYQHLYKLGTMTSVNYREVHYQLFKTLVIQTIFPSLLGFFPAACLILFPAFGVGIGENANLLMISFSNYPCFEPLVAMCCIKSFRKRILGVFRCLAARKSSQISSFSTVVVSGKVTIA